MERQRFLWALVFFSVWGLIIPQAWGQTIKIGTLFPMTGPMAGYGVDCKNGVQMAVDEINSKGGIHSLKGAKIEIVWGDHRMNPNVAVSEIERLSERENVVTIVDFPPSLTSVAASPIAERLKTPFFVSLSFADILTSRGFKYTFQQMPTAYYVSTYGVGCLEFLSKTVGRKLSKVGVIYEDTDYGQSLAKGYRAHLKDKGYAIIADISYPAKSLDLTPQMTKLKAAAPDAVIQASYLADSILMAKTAKRLQLNVPFIDNTGKATLAYLNAAGPNAEYDFIMNMWNKDIPGAMELNNRFKAIYKTDFTSHAVIVYQAILSLSEVLEVAGKKGPGLLQKPLPEIRNRLRDTLAEIDIPPGPKLVLPHPRQKYNEAGLNTHGGFIVCQVQDGEMRTVWPEKYASTKIRVNPEWWK